MYENQLHPIALAGSQSQRTICLMKLVLERPCLAAA